MNSSLFLFSRVLLRRAVLGVRDGLRRSILRTVTVLGGSLMLLVGAFVGSKVALAKLMTFPGVGEVLATRIPGLIFFMLMTMLTISSAVTFLGVFFRSRESFFLFSLPISRRTVFFWRWFESMIYSSWAFPILVFPFHLALHQTLQANVAYLASFPLFLVPFTLLVGGAGAILACALAALGITWRLVRRFLMVLVAGFLVYYTLTGATSALPQLDDDPVRFLQATLAKFSLGFSPYSPAGWWFRGAESMRAGELTTAAGYWCMMMSTGLTLLWVVLAFAPGPLFRLWAGWPGARTRRTVSSSGFFSLDRLLGFLSPQTRAMVVKDARLLARDPGQWAQSVLLFGLMATYVAGLRGMAYQNLPLKWRLLVTTANFGAIAGILASLGTRFFFPLPSLEGKMAWLVRLAPVAPERALRLKLVLGLAWTYPPTLALAAGTIIMLDLPRTLLFTAVLDTLLLDIALMSLSVGLGAILPEMGQEETSKIVSGLGGTVALLLGLSYVLVASGLIAMQLGLVPVLKFTTAYLTGTAALSILSLGVSYTVMKTAIHRVRSLEVAA